MSAIRTRWAAIGAAVAVTLGAGGLFFVDAAPNGGPSLVQTINPCRLVDTRADKGVGGRVTPLGNAEAWKVTATGVSGNCNIDTDAIGIIANVTATDASTATNLRLYPGDAAIPTSSNLNPRPGAAPTPNAVTVGLDTSDQFVIRNAAGTVNVIIDVVGILMPYDETAGKFMSFQPLLLPRFDGALEGFGLPNGRGILLPDAGTPGFELSFVMPDDYTDNNTFFLEVLWHIDETGCGIEWQTEYAHVHRQGLGTVQAGFAMVLTDPVPGTANVSAITRFQIQPSGSLESGDSVLLSLSRDAGDIGDTCADNIVVTGISLEYT